MGDRVNSSDFRGIEFNASEDMLYPNDHRGQSGVDDLINRLGLEVDSRAMSEVMAAVTAYSDTVQKVSEYAATQRDVYTSRFGRVATIHDYVDEDVKNAVSDGLNLIIVSVVARAFRKGLEMGRTNNG